MFGWIKKTFIALLLYSVHTNVCALGDGQQVIYPTGRRFRWMKRLSVINPPSVGQPDRLTRWVDEAVIIIWPALWYHPFTIYTCILALLVEKIFEVTPTSPWISQILYIHFTCIEYLWSIESENHIGPKKSIAALNRLFHGTLRLVMCEWVTCGRLNWTPSTHVNLSYRIV